MMKRTAAILALAAALSFGMATVPAMAAEGWSQENGSWVYYDANGGKVYNEWKKGADNLWRYLNGSGVMAVNDWVDSEYYVDSNGIMLTDKWLKLTGSDGEYEWYYFGSSGKMINDTWKKIDDKWYHFDGAGRMELGWILDDMYYTGTDGVMRTGWQKLVPPDDYDDQDDRVVPGYDSAGGSDDGKYWFYLGTNGKKYVPSDSSAGEYGTRKIDGEYYCFDQDGIMQTGWRDVRTGAEDDIQDYMYFGSDGKARIGWYSIEPPAELDGYDGDVEWFYFGNNGKPRASDTERLRSSDIVRISGKSYLFNHLGNPVYGLRKVYTGSGEDDWTAYYFGTKEQSSVQRGKMRITEENGEATQFYFSSNGRGATGVEDGYLYYKGKLQRAANGQKYACFDIDGDYYVVNSSGKVQKNKDVENVDDVEFVTNASGILVSADGDRDVASYAEEPEEPYCIES